MSLLTYIVIFSLLGGVVSLSVAALLLTSKAASQKMAFYATPFAAGALLAAVFLDLLPEGIETANAEQVLLAALLGILVFYFAERFLRWFHHHHQHGEGDPAVPLIVVGDTLHNALDGIAIAAAFLVSIPTGIVTTLAVAAHEIPQEIGDFGLLLDKGMSRTKVLIVNVASALATVVAAVLTYAVGSEDKLPTGVLLGLSAGFLLYIALSDVIPMLHERQDAKRLIDWQSALVVVGVVFVAVAISVTHHLVHSA